MSSTDSADRFLAPRDTFALDQSSVASVATAIIGFVALAWLATRPVAPPPPQPATAPAAVFALGRAQEDIRELALAPRMSAGDAHVKARAHIVRRLRALGLDPEVQSASAARVTRLAAGESQVQAGLVHNIIVRKEGSAPDRARRPALLVAAHYDSAPGYAPGPDPSATVGAMLETLHVLGHGAPLANDVIFLFTDGENIGSLGARVFAEQHRWARQVGLVLQFDAAGNSGPLLLTGTRGGDGKLVAAWAAAAPQAQGSSAFALLAGNAPGLHQGAPLDALGVAGMRFAAIEGGNADPLELSVPIPANYGVVLFPGRESYEAIDEANQHAGDTMLALTRHFGNVPLAGIAAPDRIHFDLPLAGQVHYATQYVWPMTRLVCLMVVLACCIAVKRSGVAAGKLLAGAAAFFVLAAVLALAATALWSGAAPVAAGVPARESWVLLAVIALAIAVFIECQRLLVKAIGIPAAMLGTLLVMTALLLASSRWLPGASYLLAWPMAGALLAYAAVQAPAIAARSSSLRLAILAAGSVPAVLLFAPLLQQMATLFTFQRSLLLVLTLALMLGLGSVPLAALRRRFVSPLLLLVCAASLTAAAHTTPEPPLGTGHLTYVQDAASWKSWWVMPAGSVDDWQQLFARGRLQTIAAMGDQRQWVAPAPPGVLQFPELRALRDEVQGGRRKVVFSVSSRNDSPTIEVRVEGTPTLRATLDGALLTARASSAWSASLHGTAGLVHRFELELVPGNTARVFVQERRPGSAEGAIFTGRGHPGVMIAADTLVFR